MSNFETFFAANTDAQREVRAFHAAATLKRQRARTDGARQKWARAMSVAFKGETRVQLANDIASQLRADIEGAVAFHGSTAATVAANPHVGEKLGQLVAILEDVRRELRRFPAFAREVLAA